jgi:hypothetical protein
VQLHVLQVEVPLHITLVQVQQVEQIQVTGAEAGVETPVEIMEQPEGRGSSLLLILIHFQL